MQMKCGKCYFRLDTAPRWDILTNYLKKLKTLMRTSTRRALLREPAQRWKAGGGANAEWTSELHGESGSALLP
jgi:hypothetical protein